jgi:hypothetical protein
MRILDGTQALRMIQVTRSAVADVRDLRRNTISLMRLDAQLAASSVITIAIFCALALLFALTAWALLVSSLVAWIADNWLSFPATLLVVALVVLAAAVPFVMLVRARAENLTFEATRRQMGGAPHEPQPSKSADEIRREIAVLESRISDEKRHLQSALVATRGFLRGTFSSRKVRTGLFLAAAAAGALAGMRARASARGSRGNVGSSV